MAIENVLLLSMNLRRQNCASHFFSIECDVRILL